MVKKLTSKIIFDEEISSLKEAKEKSKKLTSEHNEPIFVLHKKDKISCKPFLISLTRTKIPLCSYLKKNNKNGFSEEFYFLDEMKDKRKAYSNGNVFSEYFWVYQGEFDDKKYVLFSLEKLENDFYNFFGTNLEMESSLEIYKNLKLNSIDNIFIIGEAQSTSKRLDKEELIEFSKYLLKIKGWNEEGFINFLFLHENGIIYSHPKEINSLIASFLLSSKYVGYPLHMLFIGPVGSGKTTLIECLKELFDESLEIFEAGSSTIKGLIPSFREKPAAPGYLLSCNRIGFSDELFKLISKQDNQSQYRMLNNSYFGQLNLILEHKNRIVSSGNNNQMAIQATAKFLLMTNNYPKLLTLKEHIGIIDATPLSRMLIYVQDEAHQRMIYDKNNNTFRNINKKRISKDIIINWKGEEVNPFLTIYDSCQEFIIKFDVKKIKAIFNDTIRKLDNELRCIWEPRGLHHLVLLLDGLVKFRCIFKDYDKKFSPKEQDYKELEKIIHRILKSWEITIELKGGEKNG